MNIYTTNFSKLRNKKQELVPVCISRYPPRDWHGACMMELAPSSYSLSKYKATGDVENFCNDYIFGVLAKLDPLSVVDKLHTIGDGKDVALVCYEGSNKFCHRSLVAYWLNRSGFKVKEL